MQTFAVVDLETTGHTPSKGDKIIEIGIVVLENGTVVKEFSSLVNPGITIPPFISNLTGIQDEDVHDAPVFTEIVDEVIACFTDAYVVAHNVPFDLGFLNYEIQASGRNALQQPVLDTVELARILLPQAPGFKLGQLSEYLSLRHDDPHRALSDADVTAKLLLFLFARLEVLPLETLTQLQSLETRLKSDLFAILQAYIDGAAFSEQEREDLEIFRGLAIKQIPSREASEEQPLPAYADFLDLIYEQGGKLSDFMAGYEKRPGQREMSETVFDAFESKQHALIEAETGTGKSLAYLLPAIYQSLAKGQRVVISTHLTQLQSQLLEKEIPLLQAMVKFPFQAALIKGKQHYLSLSKFEKEIFSEQQDNYDITLTKAILLVWLTETNTGDIDEVQLPSSGKNFFRSISTESEGYLDPRSPWFSRSFYQRVRNKVQHANLVITNHSLFCTDLNSGFQLLPSYKMAIIDEAHHLEATAAKHFGLKLDYVGIQHLFNRIGTVEAGDWFNRALTETEVKPVSSENWDSLWQQSKAEADDLFRYVFHYVLEKNRRNTALNDIGRIQYRFEKEKESTHSWNTIQEMASRLSFLVRDLIHILSQLKYGQGGTESDSPATDLMDEVKSFIELLQNVIDELEHFFFSADSNQVKWAEIEAHGAKNAVYLYSEPVEVASALFEDLFAKKDSIVLTSATLSMNKSFDYIRERLGLPFETTIEKKIQSPYQYDQQVQLMIPNDFPDMKYGNPEAYILAVCEAVYSLAEVTEGRMLVLFTSYDMLRKAHQVLKELTEEKDFILIAQGISSGSRARLKKNFQAFERSILLGTSSFWEGVDIPGSDLSSLVIVRLPFQPPDHPVYQAKSAQLKEMGKNPFMELALPNAVIRFKQGFGRLIRSSTDRGIVMVCDERIVKARYGKYFTDSIPEVPISYDTTTKIIEKAEAWL
ncbi:ATP-dependent DNA helicase DinG [Sediminibacillus dalangtanensis]|uniref:3'-5' exonuclease DinG n=1 Tax=Sediminibacillus dalangtanensis TaxID=2729421 RepID=A0ABX7VVJ8_9BACI|nr:ATP-dependent DNA helicase DinG [Sediminibacillus dalangtanensis]QTM99630.1 ATP-dependent DNA helicase DinG [Sediminibacillus dalangtanensis]